MSPIGSPARLEPCQEAPEGLCGTVDVPLDRRGAVEGTIAIFFHYYPHTDTSRPPLEPIFATAGGPGSSITQEQPDAYRVFLLGPLRDRHDLVLIDQRGVGRSGAIDCQALQRGREDPYAATGSCGARLGAAAALYGSADVARDIEVVRAALGVPRFVFYGASYAAVDAQAYAARFPLRLRAVVLDSPVSTVTFDPWYAADAAAIRRVVRVICARSASCSAARRDGDAEFAWLARRLRRQPVDGIGPDAAGDLHTLHITESFLATHIADTDAGGFVAPSEIPAAAEALRNGDPVPLLRLAAENDDPLFGDEGDPAGFSAGDEAARYCTDQAFQWDKDASPKVRRVQWAAARDALDASRFAPFSVAAWSDYSNPDVCIEWPAPGRQVEPPVPPGTTFPEIPALVLGGDLDLVVPLEKNRDVAALFPRSRFVTILDSGHQTAFNWRADCAARLVQRFLATLDPGDTSCSTSTELSFPAIGRFPVLARDAQPAARAGPQDGSRRRDRKVAAAAAAAITDAFRRTVLSLGASGTGLRGGTFRAANDLVGITLDLSATRFAADVAVTGHAVRPWQSGAIHATVQVDGPADEDGSLRVTGIWLVAGATKLTVEGTLGGRRVALLIPAT